MKKFRGIWVAAALLLAAVLGGCQRRPLEDAFHTSLKVIIKCLWSVEMYPDGIKPTGVTFYIFRDGQFYSSITTANVDSCEVQLPEGSYRLYMISQSPQEYWKMEFANMTDFNGAETTLRTKSTPSWVSSRAGSDTVVENPEILYAGVSENFEITEEMTEEYQYHYSILKSLQSKAAGGTKAGTKADEELAYYTEKVEYYTIRVNLKPQNIVSQLWITIYSGNADVLKSVRASTSGMARTFELTRFTTNDDEAIQIISEWKLTMDDTDRRVGHVDGLINSFGLPGGERPSAVRDSTLNVSALLVDDATVADYTFSVGDKIELLSPNPGYFNLYRLVFGSVDNPAITPPDVQPSGGGGFTAGVTDWGDEIQADIPI